jgi:hypothetical protein
MKNLLLDTNIYGLALEKKDVANILIFLAEEKQKSGKKYIVLGSEIINDEINATPHKETRIKLSDLYQIVISGEIRLTDKIKLLALDYFNECKNNNVRITLEDCQIVASSCFANVNLIVTENRKTMTSPKALEVFAFINKKKRLGVPKFIGCATLKSFLFSSGVS